MATTTTRTSAGSEPTTNGNGNGSAAAPAQARRFARKSVAPALELSVRQLNPFKLIIPAWETANLAIDEKANIAGMGAPVTGTLEATADGVGYFKAYPAGWVLWRADRGALAVYGAIGARWAEIGGVSSGYGWPTTDELPTPLGPGRYNHFDGGSIYWSPDTGAHFVYGAIRDLWAALGWEQGALGLPRTDEEDVPGVPGARRNLFEGGDITWTPWAGARVTRLTASGDANPGGLTIMTVGSGGNPAPVPQVSRHVIITAAMDLTDDEGWFDDDEHAHVERRDERWVDSWDPQGVMQLVGVCGGEMRVELNATAAIRPDGSVRVGVEVKLFEGTSETTSDLDGTRSISQVVGAGQVVQIPIRINNDDEGGDFADISMTVSNSDT